MSASFATSSHLASSFCAPMTLRQWALLPEDEPGEWCDGYLEKEEMASFLHDTIVSWFAGIFQIWLVQQRTRSPQRGGFVAVSTVKYAVSSTRGRMPDLTVFLPGGRVPPREGLITIPPDIAVEVVSPTPQDQKRDRVEKLKEYAQFGINYYWLVDPYLRSFEVLELGTDGRYVHAVAATEGTVTNLPGCPELTVALDELWAEIDRLEPTEESPQ